MTQNAFGRLCYLVSTIGGVADSRYVTVEEKVAMFLSILAHHKKNRVVGHDNRRSGQTISAYFHEVLHSVLKLYLLLLIKPTAVDVNCTNDTWKWFKGCLGALDGTHIPVHVSTRDKAKYRTRKGILAVNVDFQFPVGCYYLFDNGYANVEGFLTPYRRVRSQMPDDPLEEVGEEYACVADESQTGFISTVQSSELWDDWREQLALSIPCLAAEVIEVTLFLPLSMNLVMDSGTSSASGIGLLKKAEKTRRSWSTKEEECLIQSLKDLVTKGWRSENGFRAGYLSLLEQALHKSIPGFTLRESPHIHSKMHEWKKAYSSLADPTLKSLRHKQWTLYDDWCEIFGYERATGDHSKGYHRALQEVLALEPTDVVNLEIPNSYIPTGFDDSVGEIESPASKPKTCATSKMRKRKQPVTDDDSIIDAINNLAHITKDTLGELVVTLGAEDKISVAQDKVFKALEGIHKFTDDEKIVAASLLFNNHNDLALFQRLSEPGRIRLVNRLLKDQ
ncbi:uncharacterized protein [Henckelia pumila]|uniref:uncharacterized protein n=1 Tax=Henckelia pumila TaxID=405737 RepID=UPI003C6E89FD